MSLPTKSEIQQVINNLNNRYADSGYQISDVFCDIRPNIIIIHCMSDSHLGNAYDLAISLGNKEDTITNIMPDNTHHSLVILEKKEE